MLCLQCVTSYFKEEPLDFDSKDDFKDALEGRIEVEQSLERDKRSRHKEARPCVVTVRWRTAGRASARSRMY